MQDNLTEKQPQDEPPSEEPTGESTDLGTASIPVDIPLSVEDPLTADIPPTSEDTTAEIPKPPEVRLGIDVPLTTDIPLTCGDTTAKVPKPPKGKTPRFVGPKNANVQLGPEHTHEKGPQPFFWVGKIPPTETREIQLGTKEKRPGQFRQQEAKRRQQLKKYPLPVRMKETEIEETRKAKIKKAVFNPRDYKLKDADLDDPEVVDIFDAIYPLFLPPLQGVRYKQGKNRLHQKRWMRRSQWDYFWSHPIADQIESFNCRPGLKVFFDSELGKDAYPLIRDPKTLEPVPVFNELDLVPDGFPLRTEGGDPYLTYDVYHEGEVVPLELDVDTLLSLAERNYQVPLVSLKELCGPVPVYKYDINEKYQGPKDATLHTVAIKATVDFTKPSKIPDPTPDQVRELMSLGNCGKDEAIAYYWTQMYEKCEEARASGGASSASGKGKTKKSSKS